MQSTPQKSIQGGSVLRVSWRLGLVLTLTLYLTAAVGAQSGGGDRTSCNLAHSNDGSFSSWVSCGGSAGNFLYVCDEYGCDDSEGDFNQDLADQRCAEIQAEGECPEPVEAEPLP